MSEWVCPECNEPLKLLQCTQVATVRKVPVILTPNTNYLNYDEDEATLDDEDYGDTIWYECYSCGEQLDLKNPDDVLKRFKNKIRVGRMR